MTLVSVVIPTYNSANYLVETIESVCKQDYDDFEIIIIDDKSTDNTQEIVSKLDSGRIRYYCLKKNHGGPSLPRKIGVEKANGDFIAFCDSDDLLMPDRLSTAVEFMLRCPEIGMVFTDEQKFDDSTGKILGNFLDGYDRFDNLPKRKIDRNCFVISPENAFSCLFFENYIMPSGVTVRRATFETVGGFDETLTNADDWDMWFRISRNFPIGFIRTIGFRYRVRCDSISGRGVSLAYNRIRVLQKQFDQGVPNELRKLWLEKIALHYSGIGYCYRSDGNIQQARKAYLRSLRISFTVGAAKGLLFSLFGKKINILLSSYRSQKINNTNV